MVIAADTIHKEISERIRKERRRTSKKPKSKESKNLLGRGKERGWVIVITVFVAEVIFFSFKFSHCLGEREICGKWSFDESAIGSEERKTRSWERWVVEGIRVLGESLGRSLGVCWESERFRWKRDWELGEGKSSVHRS